MPSCDYCNAQMLVLVRGDIVYPYDDGSDRDEPSFLDRSCATYDNGDTLPDDADLVTREDVAW